MSTEQHESLIPAPLSRTDIARLWREVSGATRMTPGEEEFARRVERAALEVQHALIVQMAEALDAALEGNEYSCIQGEWAWHRKQMPSNATLDKARDSHAAATQYLKGPKT